MFDLEDNRWLDGFDVQKAGLFIIEAGQIGGPVVFDGELDIMFFSRLVCRVQFKTTGNDKSEMPGDIAGLKNILATFDAPLCEMLEYFVPFLAI